MKPQIFIDGREGTTGLQIYERLAPREDISLLLIPEEKRKDREARRALLNKADLVFLCLPDEAAMEAVSLIENPHTRVIDASTAHRVSPGWVYGFPELRGRREEIKSARRVSNPGCHATGFLSAVGPLVELGVLPPHYPLTCFSLTGYSGGGKAMIAEFEDPNRSPLLDGPNIYALGLSHKHLPEMQVQGGLIHPPAFSPVLGDLYKGMAVSIQLHNRLLPGNPTARAIWETLASYYDGETVVTVAPFEDLPPRHPTGTFAGLDCLRLYVSGHEDQTLITALLDNLGKGASGAAVQNMNLMLGFAETAGLQLP